jgi:hypothetical protein
MTDGGSSIWQRRPIDRGGERSNQRTKEATTMLQTNAIDSINSLLAKLPESVQVEAMRS